MMRPSFRQTFILLVTLAVSCADAPTSLGEAKKKAEADQVFLHEGEVYLHLRGNREDAIDPFLKKSADSYSHEDPPGYHHTLVREGVAWFYAHSYLHMQSVEVDGTVLDAASQD